MMSAPTPLPIHMHLTMHPLPWTGALWPLGLSPINQITRTMRHLRAQRNRRGYLMTFASYSRMRAILSAHDSRKLFARMLWRAFPADSEHGVAEKAAPVLGLTERHVRRLLQCEHSVKIEHFLCVAALVGFETVLAMIYDHKD